jgi:predicted nucleic acid-binding protein
LVIVDNSTLSSLSFIGCVNLLNFLFDQIIIPQAIKNEFEYHHRKEMPYDFQIKNVDESFNQFLKQYPKLIDLGRGDQEVIYFAKVQNDLVISDDKKVRKFCEILGIDSIGTLRLLKTGFNQGYFENSNIYLKKIDQLSLDLYLTDELLNWAKDI